LKPAHYIVLTEDGIRKEKYWSVESKYHEDDLETTIEKVRWLFKDTVERQLVSDVPICTLLSGGLDSSAISAIASNELRSNGYAILHTYSVDYENNNKYFEANIYQPEADDYWAKFVSEYIGSEHHRVIIDNDTLAESLIEAMYARDLPGMADIDVSLYLFSKVIKNDFVVAVSGECADEIFGGYPWFYREESLNSNTFPWSRRMDSRLDLYSADITKKIKPREYLLYRYREALSEVPILDGEEGNEKRMRELFYLNLTRWMPTLLDRKDRMSMYTGLEIRVPFCDHRLVEYVWNIPWEMKNFNGMRKGILREALKGILPETIRTRPKNPYPKTFSPHYYEKVRNKVLSIVKNSDSPLNYLVNKNKILELTKYDGDFDLPWFGQLMRLPQLFAYLIQLNKWLKDYNVEIKLN
ncbi:MAG: asparagine synthase (glutamine-hydrolyzing), partial [bacterium]